MVSYKKKGLTSLNYLLLSTALTSAWADATPAQETSGINATGTENSSIQKPNLNAKKWFPQANLDLAAGSVRSIAQPGIMAPLVQTDDSMIFFDVRGMLDSRREREGNVGLGFSKLMPEGYIWRTYGFYDRRLTSTNKVVQQITVGGDILTENYDFRANVYVPITRPIKTQHASSTMKRNQVHSEFVTYKDQHYIEVPMGGFDAEVGRQVPGIEGLRLFGGFYHFAGKDVDSMNGVRVRGEYPLTSWLAVKVEGQYDKVRGAQGFLGMRMRYALGAPEKSDSGLTTLEKRMMTPIERDVDAVVGKSKKPKIAREVTKKATLDDGSEKVILHYINDPTAAQRPGATAGAGTAEDPINLAHPSGPLALQTLSQMPHFNVLNHHGYGEEWVHGHHRQPLATAVRNIPEVARHVETQRQALLRLQQANARRQGGAAGATGVHGIVGVGGTGAAMPGVAGNLQVIVPPLVVPASGLQMGSGQPTPPTPPAQRIGQKTGQPAQGPRAGAGPQQTGRQFGQQAGQQPGQRVGGQAAPAGGMIAGGNNQQPPVLVIDPNAQAGTQPVVPPLVRPAPQATGPAAPQQPSSTSGTTGRPAGQPGNNLGFDLGQGQGGGQGPRTPRDDDSNGSPRPPRGGGAVGLRARVQPPVVHTDVSSQTDAMRAAQMPVQMPVQRPVQTPVQTPVQMPVSVAPVSAPSQPPVAPITLPVNVLATPPQVVPQTPAFQPVVSPAPLFTAVPPQSPASDLPSLSLERGAADPQDAQDNVDLSVTPEVSPRAPAQSADSGSSIETSRARHLRQGSQTSVVEELEDPQHRVGVSPVPFALSVGPVGAMTDSQTSLFVAPPVGAPTPPLSSRSDARIPSPATQPLTQTMASTVQQARGQALSWEEEAALEEMFAVQSPAQVLEAPVQAPSHVSTTSQGLTPATDVAPARSAQSQQPSASAASTPAKPRQLSLDDSMVSFSPVAVAEEEAIRPLSARSSAGTPSPARGRTQDRNSVDSQTEEQRAPAPVAVVSSVPQSPAVSSTSTATPVVVRAPSPVLHGMHSPGHSSQPDQPAPSPVPDSARSEVQMPSPAPQADSASTFAVPTSQHGRRGSEDSGTWDPTQIPSPTSHVNAVVEADVPTEPLSFGRQLPATPPLLAAAKNGTLKVETPGRPESSRSTQSVVVHDEVEDSGSLSEHSDTPAAVSSPVQRVASTSPDRRVHTPRLATPVREDSPLNGGNGKGSAFKRTPSRTSSSSRASSSPVQEPLVDEVSGDHVAQPVSAGVSTPVHVDTPVHVVTESPLSATETSSVASSRGSRASGHQRRHSESSIPASAPVRPASQPSDVGSQPSLEVKLEVKDVQRPASESSQLSRSPVAPVRAASPEGSVDSVSSVLAAGHRVEVTSPVDSIASGDSRPSPIPASRRTTMVSPLEEREASRSPSPAAFQGALPPVDAGQMEPQALDSARSYGDDAASGSNIRAPKPASLNFSDMALEASPPKLPSSRAAGSELPAETAAAPAPAPVVGEEDADSYSSGDFELDEEEEEVQSPTRQNAWAASVESFAAEEIEEEIEEEKGEEEVGEDADAPTISSVVTTDTPLQRANRNQRIAALADSDDEDDEDEEESVSLTGTSPFSGPHLSSNQLPTVGDEDASDSDEEVQVLSTEALRAAAKKKHAPLASVLRVSHPASDDEDGDDDSTPPNGGGSSSSPARTEASDAATSLNGTRRSKGNVSGAYTGQQTTASQAAPISSWDAMKQAAAALPTTPVEGEAPEEQFLADPRAIAATNINADDDMAWKDMLDGPDAASDNGDAVATSPTAPVPLSARPAAASSLEADPTRAVTSQASSPLSARSAGSTSKSAHQRHASTGSASSVLPAAQSEEGSQPDRQIDNTRALSEASFGGSQSSLVPAQDRLSVVSSPRSVASGDDASAPAPAALDDSGLPITGSFVDDLLQGKGAPAAQPIEYDEEPMSDSFVNLYTGGDEQHQAAPALQEQEVALPIEDLFAKIFQGSYQSAAGAAGSGAPSSMQAAHFDELFEHMLAGMTGAPAPQPVSSTPDDVAEGDEAEGASSSASAHPLAASQNFARQFIEADQSRSDQPDWLDVPTTTVDMITPGVTPALTPAVSPAKPPLALELEEEKTQVDAPGDEEGSPAILTLDDLEDEHAVSPEGDAMPDVVTPVSVQEPVRGPTPNPRDLKPETVLPTEEMFANRPTTDALYEAAEAAGYTQPVEKDLYIAVGRMPAGDHWPNDTEIQEQMIHIYAALEAEIDAVQKMCEKSGISLNENTRKVLINGRLSEFTKKLLLPGTGVVVSPDESMSEASQRIEKLVDTARRLHQAQVREAKRAAELQQQQEQAVQARVVRRHADVKALADADVLPLDDTLGEPSGEWAAFSQGPSALARSSTGVPFGASAISVVPADASFGSPALLHALGLAGAQSPDEAELSMGEKRRSISQLEEELRAAAAELGLANPLASPDEASVQPGARRSLPETPKMSESMQRDFERYRPTGVEPPVGLDGPHPLASLGEASAPSSARRSLPETPKMPESLKRYFGQHQPFAEVSRLAQEVAARRLTFSQMGGASPVTPSMFAGWGGQVSASLFKATPGTVTKSYSDSASFQSADGNATRLFGSGSGEFTFDSPPSAPGHHNSAVEEDDTTQAFLELEQQAALEAGTSAQPTPLQPRAVPFSPQQPQHPEDETPRESGGTTSAAPSPAPVPQLLRGVTVPAIDIPSAQVTTEDGPTPRSGSASSRRSGRHSARRTPMVSPRAASLAAEMLAGNDPTIAALLAASSPVEDDPAQRPPLPALETAQVLTADLESARTLAHAVTTAPDEEAAALTEAVRRRSLVHRRPSSVSSMLSEGGSGEGSEASSTTSSPRSDGPSPALPPLPEGEKAERLSVRVRQLTPRGTHSLPGMLEVTDAELDALEAQIQAEAEAGLLDSDSDAEGDDIPSLPSAPAEEERGDSQSPVPPTPSRVAPAPEAWSIASGSDDSFESEDARGLFNRLNDATPAAGKKGKRAPAAVKSVKTPRTPAMIPGTPLSRAGSPAPSTASSQLEADAARARALRHEAAENKRLQDEALAAQAAVAKRELKKKQREFLQAKETQEERANREAAQKRREDEHRRALQRQEKEAHDKRAVELTNANQEAAKLIINRKEDRVKFNQKPPLEQLQVLTERVRQLIQEGNTSKLENLRRDPLLAGIVRVQRAKPEGKGVKLVLPEETRAKVDAFHGIFLGGAGFSFKSKAGTVLTEVPGTSQAGASSVATSSVTAVRRGSGSSSGSGDSGATTSPQSTIASVTPTSAVQTSSTTTTTTAAASRIPRPATGDRRTRVEESTQPSRLRQPTQTNTLGTAAASSQGHAGSPDVEDEWGAPADQTPKKRDTRSTPKKSPVPLHVFNAAQQPQVAPQPDSSAPSLVGRGRGKGIVNPAPAVGELTLEEWRTQLPQQTVTPEQPQPVPAAAGGGGAGRIRVMGPATRVGATTSATTTTASANGRGRGRGGKS